MPVKSSNESQEVLYFITPDGAIHECSGIIESVNKTIDDLNDFNECNEYDASAFEVSFRITNDINRTIFRVAMMMLPNNFRRMHGLPLKRRIKRRRKKNENANRGRA